MTAFWNPTICILEAGRLTVSRNGAAHDEGPKPRLWPFVA